MKRLVDRHDPDDEIVRLLIRAGANHQPAPGSKLRLIAALGVGSAVGLSASKVLAWLGTGGGKMTLAMTVVGTAAGGAYLMASSPAPKAPAPMVAAPIATLSAPAPSAALPPAPLPARAEPPEPVAAQASAPNPALARQKHARSSARASPSGPPVRPPEAARGTSGEDAAREVSLTEETTWVDQLRLAAERHDRPAFDRLLEQYSERFPEGQLRPEVNRLRISTR